MFGVVQAPAVSGQRLSPSALSRWPFEEPSSSKMPARPQVYLYERDLMIDPKGQSTNIIRTPEFYVGDDEDGPSGIYIMYLLAYCGV